jgi:hypothetical protein
MSVDPTIDVGGLSVPDLGPAFLAVLAVHVAAGLTAVVAGLLTTTARKRAGRHPGAGRVYLGAVAAVFLTATLMAVQRWREDWRLFIIAAVTFGLALVGWWARRRRRPAGRSRLGRGPRWLPWHAWAMSGSFMALLTGFYVDNGPRLPVWDRMPPVLHWTLPWILGVPLTWSALSRARRRRGRQDRQPVGADSRPMRH